MKRRQRQLLVLLLLLAKLRLSDIPNMAPMQVAAAVEVQAAARRQQDAELDAAAAPLQAENMCVPQASRSSKRKRKAVHVFEDNLGRDDIDDLEEVRGVV